VIVTLVISNIIWRDFETKVWANKLCDVNSLKEANVKE